MRLDAPCQVRLLGKGSKVRLCPLWPITARLLRELITECKRCDPDPGSTLIFANARGSALTRYGVRYLLRRYVARAAGVAPTLKGKSLHPHSIRHSTAIALLKAGEHVFFTVVDARGALEAQALFAGDFSDGAIRCEVAVEDGDVAGFFQGFFYR